MAAKKPKSSLREWREKHQGEMEKNLQTLIAIRDDTDASDKDRIEASKNLSRILGGLAPERGSKSSSGSSAADILKTTPEEDKQIDEILGKNENMQ